FLHRGSAEAISAKQVQPEQECVKYEESVCAEDPYEWRRNQRVQIGFAENDIAIAIIDFEHDSLRSGCELFVHAHEIAALELHVAVISEAVCHCVVDRFIAEECARNFERMDSESCSKEEEADQVNDPYCGKRLLGRFHLTVNLITSWRLGVLAVLFK